MTKTRALSARLFTFLLCLFLLFTSFPPAIPVAVAQEGGEPAHVDEAAQTNVLTGKVMLGDAGLAGVTITATYIPPAGKPRIILLPGIMGTELKNTKSCGDGAAGKLWIDLPLIKLGRLDPLYLNATGDGPRDACNQIDPAGRTWVAFFQNPYGEFVTKATAAGFNILAYPGFDWRLDLRSQVAELDKWLNLHATGPEPIYLVGHSMGGLLARAYVSNETGAARIAGVVTVGTPYLGAPVMAQRIVDGLTGTGADKAMKQYQLKEIARYSPGFLQLLPSPAYFTGIPGFYIVKDGSPLTYSATVDHLVDWNHIKREIMEKATTFHNDFDGFDKSFAAAGKYTVLYSTAYWTPVVYLQRPRTIAGSIEVMRSAA